MIKHQTLHSCFSIIFMFLLIAFTSGQNAFAQAERKEIRKGNSLYENGKYADAETEYRKALDKNKASFLGNYNLGGALYRQQKYDDAIREYKESVSKSNDKSEQANAYHNLGNSLIKAQQYGEAVDAFKKSLKLKPDDEDTRYNLAYAQAMLKNQQKQQQQQGNNKNDQKDQKDQKDQNKQNQDQNKEQQDQQQQAENKEQQKQEQQQQQRQQQQPKMSKEDAERLLKALQNDEKNLQEKLTRKEGQKIRVEKEW